LLAKLAAQALTEHPPVNARFEGETIVQSAAVNIGIAVDTERGLLVPVVRDVQAKSLRQVAEAAARLIEQARSGHVSPDDLRGGTFTITNLGMYEIDAFSPIIKPAGMRGAGVGRIVAKQVVVDPEAERVCHPADDVPEPDVRPPTGDGAPAARFLQRSNCTWSNPICG